MDCQNCKTSIVESAEFCFNCGAKNVRERITTRGLLTEFSDIVLGWDNKFFFTIKTLLVNPRLLFTEYLTGTRKKYVAPLSFFALGTAIALIIFNQFDTEYIALSNQINADQFELIESTTNTLAQDSTLTATESGLNNSVESILERNTKIQKIVLKYFNIFSFLLLPFYAFIAYLVFGKPYNYAEHLVVNAYLQGFLFLTTVVFFLMSLTIYNDFYLATFILAILFYSYTYGKLYQLSFGKNVVKILKFLGVLIGLFVIIMILVGIIGIFVGMAMKKFN